MNGFSQEDEFSVTLVNIIDLNVTSKLVLETFINKCYVTKVLSKNLFSNVATPLLNFSKIISFTDISYVVNYVSRKVIFNSCLAALFVHSQFSLCR